MANFIDERLIQYTVFKDKDELGTSTVTLPTISALTTSVSGAGISGVFDSITPGYFDSMQATLNFRTMNEGAAIKLMVPEAHLLVFRAVVQRFDKTQVRYIDVQKSLTIRGFTKSHNLGTAENLNAMDSSIEIEVLYIKAEEDVGNGLTALYEIDKISNIYRVNGVDYNANRRRMLGL